MESRDEGYYWVQFASGREPENTSGWQIGPRILPPVGM